MKAGSSFERVEPESRQQWREWLAENHAGSPGVWIVYRKPKSGLPSLTYDEAVEEALCFGWIDSTVNALDEYRFMQMMTPRKPGSTWAQTNKRRVERLIAEDLMTPAGMAVIEAAKADGSWTMLDDVENLVVPDDLAAALAENPEAESTFSAFAPSAKKPILYYIKSAKRPETRARRIEKTVRMAARGLRVGVDKE